MTSSLLSSAPDYGRLRISSVVDFVRIRVDLARASNGWSVNKLVGTTYADPVDAGSSGNATTFVLTFNGPRSWADVHQALQPLEASHGFTNEPQLTEVEVSLDAFSLDNDRAALLDMTARFLKFSSNLCSANARFTGERGRDRVSGAYHASADVLKAKLDRGLTVQIGNETDHLRQRVYLKATDRSGKVLLPIKEHRARIEVNLKGDRLPFVLLTDAPAFQFETLKEWFRFRKARPGLKLSPVQWMAFRNLPALGSRGSYKRRISHRWTAGDSILNRRVYDALRDLTRKMNTPANGAA